MRPDLVVAINARLRKMRRHMIFMWVIFAFNGVNVLVQLAVFHLVATAAISFTCCVLMAFAIFKMRDLYARLVIIKKEYLFVMNRLAGLSQLN